MEIAPFEKGPVHIEIGTHGHILSDVVFQVHPGRNPESLVAIFLGKSAPGKSTHPRLERCISDFQEGTDALECPCPYIKNFARACRTVTERSHCAAPGMGHFEGYRSPELVPKKYLRGGVPFSLDIPRTQKMGSPRSRDQMGSPGTGTQVPASRRGFLALIRREGRAPQEKHRSSRNGNASLAEIVGMPHRTNFLRCDAYFSLTR